MSQETNLMNEEYHSKADDDPPYYVPYDGFVNVVKDARRKIQQFRYMKQGQRRRGVMTDF